MMGSVRMECTETFGGKVDYGYLYLHREIETPSMKDRKIVPKETSHQFQLQLRPAHPPLYRQSIDRESQSYYVCTLHFLLNGEKPGMKASIASGTSPPPWPPRIL